MAVYALYLPARGPTEAEPWVGLKGAGHTPVTFDLCVISVPKKHSIYLYSHTWGTCPATLSVVGTIDVAALLEGREAGSEDWEVGTEGSASLLPCPPAVGTIDVALPVTVVVLSPLLLSKVLGLTTIRGRNIAETHCTISLYVWQNFNQTFTK